MLNSSVEISSFRGPYFFLSNFYIHPVIYKGMTWRTSEHAFQAAKACDNDQIGICAIKMANTPAMAKKLGKRVKMRPDWEDTKVSVMQDIIRAKFSNPTLSKMLLDTGEAELIEGNDWYDIFWGCVRDENGNWTGKNWLGKLLMEVRQELRDKLSS